MDEFQCPSHPVICIIGWPSESGKSCFLTKLILNTINDFGKTYISSPSLHQELDQKNLECVITSYQGKSKTLLSKKI